MYKRTREYSTKDILIERIHKIKSGKADNRTTTSKMERIRRRLFHNERGKSAIDKAMEGPEILA